MRRKRLGIPPDLYAVPLTGARGAEPSYDWVVDAPAQNAITLRKGGLALALLTPIDYARESSLYYIVHGIAVASRGGDESISLLFREGLHRLNTLAIDPSSASEIILARIILAEQFNLRPTLVPYQEDPAGALKSADAVLVSGDRALRMVSEKGDTLDLVEEWVQMTSLPYVHGIWCGREHAVGADDCAHLVQLSAEGRADFDALSEEAARAQRLGAMDAPRIREYLEQLTFDATDEVEEGLREFIRYAYYHGVLPDIADLQYYGDAPEENDEPTTGLPAIH